ncbi:SDR family oxidoreductase [Dasania marina]|uniref:SDR family NAD(P)-dependent oxidoreductase n=1 Tax=Dasania marina TaxID=471499 RepID=UPI0030DC8D71|tara:strand:+ start:14410 stop:15162 length:753 start_codon:yes stop_codon:yes gene_type:complete
MSLILKNKIAIVTGATSGIGKATALELARCGASILLIGRNQERGQALVTEFNERGFKSELLCGDINNHVFCEKLVSYCKDVFGRIDIVVNCAGVIYRADAINTTNEQWENTLTTNLTAPFYISRAALPSLMETRGNIVNVSSDWGLVGGEQAAAYCASKGGLIMLTKSMAKDSGPHGVRINAVCPGDTQTPMIDLSVAEANGSHENLGTDLPLRRTAKPEEIACSIRYLASDDASFITGAALAVDGGNSA